MVQNSNNNNHNPKMNFQNNHGRSEGRFSGRDRRYSHDKNHSSENKDKSGDQDQIRFKGKDDTKYTSKPKGIERISIDGKQKSRNSKNTASSGLYQSSKSGGGNSRYRSSPRNSSHSEISGRRAQSRRTETLEDIKADIERIDKDIQFEIKQIKAVKLGL